MGVPYAKTVLLLSSSFHFLRYSLLPMFPWTKFWSLLRNPRRRTNRKTTSPRNYDPCQTEVTPQTEESLRPPSRSWKFQQGRNPLGRNLPSPHQNPCHQGVPSSDPTPGTVVKHQGSHIEGLSWTRIIHKRRGVRPLETTDTPVPPEVSLVPGPIPPFSDVTGVYDTKTPSRVRPLHKALGRHG